MVSHTPIVTAYVQRRESLSWKNQIGNRSIRTRRLPTSVHTRQVLKSLLSSLLRWCCMVLVEFVVCSPAVSSRYGHHPEVSSLPLSRHDPCTSTSIQMSSDVILGLSTRRCCDLFGHCILAYGIGTRRQSSHCGPRQCGGIYVLPTVVSGRH